MFTSLTTTSWPHAVADFIESVCATVFMFISVLLLPRHVAHVPPYRFLRWRIKRILRQQALITHRIDVLNTIEESIGQSLGNDPTDESIPLHELPPTKRLLTSLAFFVYRERERQIDNALKIAHP